MEPENGGLEDDPSLQWGGFWVPNVNFQGFYVSLLSTEVCNESSSDKIF